MNRELAEVIERSAPHATLEVGGDRWELHVYGLSRVGRDMFVHVAVTGPRVCTATVRARAPIGNPETARRVLAAVRDWILSDDDADQAYLEISPLTELAS